MDPITRGEIYMAAAAGKYTGELPAPVSRGDYFWIDIIRRIDEGSSVKPEDIDAAIAAYLDSHGADIVTEAELADALAGKATASHSHAQSDITGLSDALAGKAAASHSHAQGDVTGLSETLAGKAAASHSHDDRYYTEAEIDTALSGKAAASHSHDDRYYTEAETDTKLGGKSNTGHTHDDRYYTETEVDTLLSGKADATDIPDVTAFITRAVNDLTNYYTKSETYTQSEIDSMVSAIPKFAIEVVSALPVADISATTVYLLTVQNGQQGNMYDEYIHVGNSWELLGTQTVDLSGYYTSAQVDALLSGLPVAGHTHDDRYYTETEIDGMVQTLNTAIGGKAASSHTHDDRYYTEAETDTLLSGKSNTGHSHDAATTAADGMMSAADKTKLDGIAAGAQVNVKPDWNAASGAAAEILNKPANLVQDASYVHTDSNFTAVEKTKLAGCKKITALAQAAYETLDPPDSDTVYLILEAVS